jgi:hypothetical protein
MEDKLVVFLEHQSTVCENMPLRLHIYSGRFYEKWLEADEKIKKAAYGSKLLKIPTPEFYVLYNGRAEFPERKILRLSDAFQDLTEAEKESSSVQFGGRPELIVPVYNINKDFNQEMLGKSKTLFGYSFFVDSARRHEDDGHKGEEAIRRAVEDCIEKDILVDFLRERSLEVINMLTAEFKLEDAQQVWKEEGIEEGIEKGKEEVAKNLLTNGFSLDIIAQSVGMPLEKIRALIN